MKNQTQVGLLFLKQLINKLNWQYLGTVHTLKDKGYCKKTQRLDAHLKVILANLIKGEEVYQHRYK